MCAILFEFIPLEVSKIHYWVLISVGKGYHSLRSTDYGFTCTILWVDKTFKQMLNEDWFMGSVVFGLFVVLYLGCHYIQIVTGKWSFVFFQGLWAPQIDDSVRCQPITLSFEVFVFISEIPPIVTACVSALIEESGLSQLVLSPLKTSKNLP